MANTTSKNTLIRIDHNEYKDTLQCIRNNTINYTINYARNKQQRQRRDHEQSQYNNNCEMEVDRNSHNSIKCIQNNLKEF